MNLTKRIVTAVLAATTTLGVMPATAQAATSVTVAYRDYDGRAYRDYRDYRDDYRRDYRRDSRNWDRDRDGIPNRYDRYDNRRGWGWNNGDRYRDNRCWTEWRYDGRRDRRVQVRYCR